MSVPMRVMAVGTGISVIGQLQGGGSAKRRGRTQKILNDLAAGQVVAVGQRNALEEKRQAELMASRALAVAAAGGAAQDIDNLIADISGEGVYRANVAMYEAESEAERLKYEGEMALQEGKDLQRSSQIGAVGTILTGAATMSAYSK